MAASSGTTSRKRCRNCAKKLADIHVGKQRLAQLQHHGFFGPLAIGKVACDLGETGEFAGRVTNRGEDDVRPEARAVFANAPAFFFNSAALRSQTHQFLQAGCARYLPA